MDSNSSSPGICQRLVDFILCMLRRPSEIPGSNQIPVEEGSSRNPINRPNGFSDSEIMVDFRHTSSSGIRSQRNESVASKKDGLIVSNDQIIQQNGFEGKGGSKDQGNELKKTVTIKESEKKKGANQSADQEIRENNQTHEDAKPRLHWPLLSVASNINEKSDAFINKKKKDMSRNYSLDPEKS